MYPDVEGYGVVSEGETYHPTAFANPAEDFKFAGDPQKQAEYQDDKGTVKDYSPPAITDEQSNASEETTENDLKDQIPGETVPATETESETTKVEFS